MPSLHDLRRQVEAITTEVVASTAPLWLKLAITDAGAALAAAEDAGADSDDAILRGSVALGAWRTWKAAAGKR